MGNSTYIANAGTFLISTLFGIYLLIVMLRLLLQVVRADFYNPVSQLLVKATSPVLVPLRRIIPGVGGIDWASIVLLLVLQMVELTLILSVLGYVPTFSGLIIWSVAQLLDLLLKVFIFSILIVVILSWIAPNTYHPVNALLHQLTNPVLRPARRMIPPMGGFDLSPIAAFIVLELISMLVVAPLMDLGQRLAMGG